MDVIKAKAIILRRLTQNLKEQNWTAITIEFVLLVVGVFLGIQVANWNEDRATAQKAAVFTTRLISVLQKEAWGNESIISHNRQTNANQRRVVDAVAGQIELSDEQFLVNAYRATQYLEVVRYRATFDELLSTGAIGLIADQTLRKTAVSVFTAPLLQQISQETKVSEYRRLFRESVSAELQEALLTRCGDRYVPELDYGAIASQLDYPCALEVAAEKIQAAANDLKALPRLVPALQVRFADNQTALFNLQVGNKAVLDNLRAITAGTNLGSAFQQQAIPALLVQSGELELAIANLQSWVYTDVSGQAEQAVMMPAIAQLRCDSELVALVNHTKTTAPTYAQLCGVIQ